MSTCEKCKARTRSDEEHNLLFGCIGLAFENWPHAHPYKPDDAECLRAWLAIEVGHTEILEVPQVLGTDPKAIAEVGKFFCGGKRHFRMGRAGDGFVILRPLTMKKSEISVREFRSVADAIYQIIEAETGITPAIYKQQKQHKRERTLEPA